MRKETDILSRLIRLKRLDGITNEELQKALLTIPDKVILEVARRGFFKKEAAEILKERVKEWTEAKTVEAIKSDDRRLSELAHRALVEKMTKWLDADLRKALDTKDPVQMKAMLEVEKRKTEINGLRKKLGLNPLP